MIKTAALIVKNYKLILGTQLYGFWQGPVYPNASTNKKDQKNPATVDCVSGCVFDILKDPTEQTDLGKKPSLFPTLLLVVRHFVLKPEQDRLGTNIEGELTRKGMLFYPQRRRCRASRQASWRATRS